MFLLPKPPRPFTGRKAFLDDLATAISDEAVILIEGIRGIGKTAAMLKIANELPWNGDSDRGLRRVFWLDLLPGASLGGFATSVLGIMGSRGLQTPLASEILSPGKTNEEILGQLVYTLNRFPCVFFVDNAQTMPGDDLRLVLSCFGTYLRGATFVFATSETVFSRGELPGLDYDLMIRRLQPLSREEGRELFEAMLKRYGSVSREALAADTSNQPRRVLATPFERAWEVSGGNPMALRMLANLCCGSPALFSGSATIPPGSATLTGLNRGPALPTGELAATLDQSQGLLVSALMEIALPVPAEAIGAAQEVAGALEPLERRFFLDRNGFGHVMVSQPVASEVDRGTVEALAVKILEAATERLRQIALGLDFFDLLGRQTPETAEGETYLQALWLRLVEILPPGNDLYREAALLSKYLQAMGNRDLGVRLWKAIVPHFDTFPKDEALQTGISMIFNLNFVGRGPEAIELGTRLVTLGATGPIAECLDLAMGLVVTGTQEKARGLELLARACESTLPGVACVAMRTRACVLLDTGDHGAMKRLYERALAIARANGFLLEEKTIIIDIATMNVHVGNIREAAETLDGFLNSMPENLPQSAVAELYGVKAFCLLKQNRFRESLQWSDKSMEIYSRLGMWVMYYMVLANHAQVLTLSERYDEAMAEFLKCLDFVRETGDARGLPIILNNISQTHFRKGEINSSVRVLTESLEASKKQGNLKNMALGHVNLAVLYITMGRLEDALQTAELALGEVRAIGFMLDLVKALVVRAEVLMKLGRFAEARKSMVEAREESRARNYLTEEALSLCYIAVLDAALGEVDSAADNADRSVTLSIRYGATCLNLFNHCVLLFILAWRGDAARFGTAEAIYKEVAGKYFKAHNACHAELARVLRELLALRSAGVASGSEIDEVLGSFVKITGNLSVDKFASFAAILARAFSGYGSGRDSNVREAGSHQAGAAGACRAADQTRTAEPGSTDAPAGRESSAAEGEVLIDASGRVTDPRAIEAARSRAEGYDLFLDFGKMRFCTSWGGEIDLARKRAILPLLRHLAENAGRGYKVSELYERVWGGEFEKEQAPVVHVNVQRLRKLMERDPSAPAVLQTRYSPEGENIYVFEPPACWAFVFTENS